MYLLPAAIVGVVLGLVRPTGRIEQAFATLTVGLVGALFLESSIVSAEVEIDPYMERYVIMLFPLLVPAAAIAVRHRSSRRTLFGGLVAGSLMIVAFRAPVSLITASGMQSHSSYLRAVVEFETTVGTANAALAISLMAIAGAALGVLVLARPHLMPALLTICLVTNLGALALSVKQDRAGAAYAAETTLTGDRSWVDHAARSQVTYLETPGTTRLLGIEQMFWNRSIRRVARMDGAETLDHAPAAPTTIGRDGTILADGRPVTGSLLVSRIGNTVRLGNVVTLAATPSLILGRAAEPARLTLLADRTSDGWLVRRGFVRVWQPNIAVRGTVVLRVTNPRAQATLHLGLTAPSYRRTVRVLPGETVTIRVPVCSSGPWRLAYRADRATFVDGRVLSLRAPSEPRFVPSGDRRSPCGTG